MPDISEAQDQDVIDRLVAAVEPQAPLETQLVQLEAAAAGEFASQSCSSVRIALAAANAAGVVISSQGISPEARIEMQDKLSVALLERFRKSTFLTAPAMKGIVQRSKIQRPG